MSAFEIWLFSSGIHRLSDIQTNAVISITWNESLLNAKPNTNNWMWCRWKEDGIKMLCWAIRCFYRWAAAVGTRSARICLQTDSHEEVVRDTDIVVTGSDWILHNTFVSHHPQHRWLSDTNPLQPVPVIFLLWQLFVRGNYLTICWGFSTSPLSINQHVRQSV